MISTQPRIRHTRTYFSHIRRGNTAKTLSIPRQHVDQMCAHPPVYPATTGGVVIFPYFLHVLKPPPHIASLIDCPSSTVFLKQQKWYNIIFRISAVSYSSRLPASSVNQDCKIKKRLLELQPSILTSHMPNTLHLLVFRKTQFSRNAAGGSIRHSAVQPNLPINQ